MILGIGTDLVEVARFAPWQKYPLAKLERVFANAELADCVMADGSYEPEKLAVRFAAKEAFYKALSAALIELNCTEHSFSLLSISTFIAVIKSDPWQVPRLVVDWSSLEALIGASLPPLSIHLSLSHERAMALAFVIVART